MYSYLEPEERFQILEYLKLMDYVEPQEGNENPYEPTLCPNREKEQECQAELRRRTAALRIRFPEWGSPEFRRDQWQQHCTSDDLVYGDHMPKPAAPDGEWATWELASDCSLYTLYLESEEAGRE